MYEQRWECLGPESNQDTGIFRPGAGVANAAESHGSEAAVYGGVADL